MDSKLKQSKTKVNAKATQPEPNHNKDESKDLITPVVSPDDSQDLGAKAASPVSKVSNPFPNQGDPKKLKGLNLPTVKEDEEIDFDMSSELKSVFTEANLDLSDEFFGKLSNILEAALRTHIRNYEDALASEYEAALAEEVVAIKEDLEYQIDSVLSTVCEEWQQENQLAIEYGIRNELTESFIEGLKNLFESHYIEVPDTKYDLVEDLEEQLEDLKEDFSRVYEDNVTLKENLDYANKINLLQAESQDLTDFQKEKFFELSEGFLGSDYDSFAHKVATIKENHFPQYESHYLTEDVVEQEYISESVDPVIARIEAELL